MFVSSNGKKTEFILDRTTGNHGDVEEHENEDGCKGPSDMPWSSYGLIR